MMMITRMLAKIITIKTVSLTPGQTQAERLLEWEYDHLTATYFILLSRWATWPPDHLIT